MGQQEILWKHELQESVSTAFFSSPKLSREKVIADQNMDYRQVGCEWWASGVL